MSLQKWDSGPGWGWAGRGEGESILALRRLVMTVEEDGEEKNKRGHSPDVKSRRANSALTRFGTALAADI